MAEIVLKVGDAIAGDNKTYQDGDVLCAFTDRHIKCVHAEHICHIKTVAFNSDGLNPAGTLPEKFRQRTSQYKFERVSKYEIRRTNQLTQESEILSNIPNEKGEYIHVPLYLARRKLHPGHVIFGTEGNEIWYGGRRDVSESIVDAVWNDIETCSEYRKTDHVLWPLGVDDKRVHLGIKLTNNITEETQARIVNIETNKPPGDYPKGEEQQIDRKRRANVQWRDLNLATVEDIENPSKSIDVRENAQAIGNILLYKNRVTVWPTDWRIS